MDEAGARERTRAAAADLPIREVLPDLLAAMAGAGHAVLVAPPGAGKTTLVPLALLEAPWRGTNKILVLEPRRLAARAAAKRMAALLGEPLGQRIGLRTRFDAVLSAKTQILVVTEGVFSRMAIEDPALSGLAAILFDEFHERSLDADFGLALALDSRGALRPDLRLIVMSATLDDAAIAGLLGGAPVITSAGRAFPVQTRYRGREPKLRIEDEVKAAIFSAIRTERGSILVFLPGQGEISHVARLLAESGLPADCDIAPLYGALDPAAQDAAIRPAAAGRRKIVLATSIAETSITIEGVRIVIDSGLMRVPRYEAGLGISRLETVRVSRASADQRRGRAGRTEPGLAIRLWDEAEDQGLIPFNRPEILDADLSGFRLDCAAWGCREPGDLALLDAPPLPAWREAEALLRDLGALAADRSLSARGRLLRALPLAPRAAALVLEGASRGQAHEAAQLAALLSERGIGGASTDMAEKLARFSRESGPRATQIRQMAERWAKAAQRALAGQANLPALSMGGLLALVFPDRLGRRRGDGQFALANGRMAMLDPADPLAKADFLVAADVTGSAARARITLGAEIQLAEIEALFEQSIVREDRTWFLPEAGALRRQRRRRLGALALDEAGLGVEANLENAILLAREAAKRGIDRLGWSEAHRAMRARVGFLRANGGDWPDLSEEALAAHVEDWLAPFLIGVFSLQEIGGQLLGEALEAALGRARLTQLDREAPTSFTAPTGLAHKIRYEGENAPLLSIRVQELFGQTRHPAIAHGRLPLTLELLSPAQRPLQITRDLPGFWAGSWAEVRAAMRGRYPKHPWPEDPAKAMPTARAKPRGSG